MYEYKVVEIREAMRGGAISGEKLELELNGHGANGWRVVSIVDADVKGRVGKGAVGGLIVTFEREKASAT